MQQLIAIALGGSCGAVTRFLVANGIYAWLGRGFPHGTLFINVSGSLLMGFLSELMLQRFPLASEYRAAILIGFLGAYTTFSTFSLETLNLFEAGNVLKAFLNIFLSTVLCLMACWLGLIWGRALFGNPDLSWLQQAQPYFGLLLNLVGLFLLSILAELLLVRFAIEASIRAGFYVMLLGGLSISSTLWFVFKQSPHGLEMHGLLAIFAFNTLFGVAMVWSGSSLGNWIWQLKLSQ